MVSLILASVTGLALAGEYGAAVALLVGMLQLVALVLPLGHTLSRFAQVKDAMDPIVVAGATYTIFHILFAPLVLLTPSLLAHRGLHLLTRDDLLVATIVSYVVLILAWIGYLVGLRGGTFFSFRSTTRRAITPTFVFVGAAFVILGLIGNIGILGGIGTYFAKVPFFYERWTVYEEHSVYGGTKWYILMRFLPVGLLILAYGGYRIMARSSRRPWLLVGLLTGASVANVFLSSASGGRGLMLWTALFSVIVYNHALGPLSRRSLLTTLFGLGVLAYVMGQLRGASYYGTTSVFAATAAVTQFAGLYLTNYVGTLALAHEVVASGTVQGATAFAGLTGLLGGSTPLTTQAEMWFRLTGSYEGSNPRYGLPGELFFNFGYLGVVLGMALVGLAVGAMTRWRAARMDRSVPSVLVAVFVAFSAHFLMTANMSYLPPYFTYYAAPFYLVFALFMGRDR